MLPQKLYEVLRWLIVIVSPAFCNLLLDLNVDNADVIVLYISKITLFLGIIFGISKIVNDNKSK